MLAHGRRGGLVRPGRLDAAHDERAEQAERAEIEQHTHGVTAGVDRQVTPSGRLPGQIVAERQHRSRAAGPDPEQGQQDHESGQEGRALQGLLNQRRRRREAERRHDREPEGRRKQTAFPPADQALTGHEAHDQTGRRGERGHPQVGV